MADQRKMEIVIGVADKASASFKKIASQASSSASKIKSELGKTINGPKVNTSKTEKEFSKLFTKIKSGLKSVSESALSIGTGIGVGLGAIGAIGYDSFKEVSSGATKLKATTGLLGKDLENITNTAKNIYKEGFGDNFDNIGNVVGLVRNELGLTGSELSKVSESVLAYNKTFDSSPQEYLRATSSLTKQLGGDIQSNTDLLISARQQIGDTYGDYLDTVNEYSTQAQKAGMSTKDFLNTLISGSKSGVFMLDKTGDSIKEFSLRLQSGDEKARSTYAIIKNILNQPNRNFELEFTDSNPEVRKKVFKDMITGALLIKDKVKQTEVLTGLMGTQFEDTGVKAVKALTSTVDYLGNAKGKTEELINTYKESDSQKFEGTIREFKTLIGEVIFTKENIKSFFDLINNNKGAIESGIKSIGNAFIELAKFAGAIAPVITVIISKISEFTSAHPNITAMVLAFGLLAGPILALVGIISQVISVIGVLVGGASLGAVIAVAGGVAIALGAIYYWFDDICSIISKTIDWISKFVSESEVLKDIGNGISGFFSGVFGNGSDVNINSTQAQVIPQSVTSTGSQSNITNVNLNGTSIFSNKDDLNKLGLQIAKSQSQLAA